MNDILFGFNCRFCDHKELSLDPNLGNKQNGLCWSCLDDTKEKSATELIRPPRNAVIVEPYPTFGLKGWYRRNIGGRLNNDKV